MSLFDRMIKLGMPLIPKLIVGKVARRYVAGTTLDDAVSCIKSLAEEGAMATLDVLGEEVKSRAKAEAAVNQYLAALDRIADEELDANISVKPTLVGLKIDEELCYEMIATITARAKELGNFVRVDMEDHSCTDATIRLFQRLLEAYGNVGLVLQSYLHRTLADIEKMLPLRPNIRICKGIYREPRSIAWLGFETVQANFIYAMEKLIDNDCYVGIATHDPYLVCAGMATVDRLDLQRDQYEFQMLLGVDPELRRIILENGHRLRVYVPYGEDWYPYSMRRLRENPTIAMHVMKAMVGLRSD
jgi:proline dehydrogenase